MEQAHLISYEDIPNQAWARLEAAADDRRHPMRLVTLATTDELGRPDSRILVLRGASREESRLWFHTDSRSKKIAHLLAQPYACIHAFGMRDDVQLRILGPVTLHRDDELADRHWQQTHMSIRHGYGSDHNPGEPLPEHDPRVQHQQQLVTAEHADAGRSNFLVIELQVKSIDWVQVNGPHQRRAAIHAGGNWAVEPLVP